MRWYFVFFVVSGFCSLVYEIVWLRLSMASFGVTTALVSIVVSMFMAGLGLGSWGAGILVRRSGVVARSLLRWYGLAELLIGISALLVPYELKMGPHFAASPEYGRGVAVVTLLLTFWPLDRCHAYSLVYLHGLNVSSADGSDRTNIRTQG